MLGGVRARTDSLTHFLPRGFGQAAEGVYEVCM